jgi:DNA-binding Lrp family transcriptional regulator
MTPANGSPEIVWQVFLGCNNAWRLAKELGISKGRAYRRLSRALDAGLIERVGRGHYAVKNKKTALGYVCGIGIRQ